MHISIPVSGKSNHTLYWQYIIGCIFILLSIVTPVHAQENPDSTQTADSAEAAVPEVAVPDWPEDSLGRRTPRGAVSGFIKAVAAQNYQRAARYLNIDPALQESEEGARLAQGLQLLLDQEGGIIPYSWMSDKYEGHLDDDLEANLDRVGSASVNNESFPLYVEKTEGPNGAPVWLFSSQSVQLIPMNITAEVPLTPVDRMLPDFLKDNRWGGVPIGHWLAMLLLAVMTYLLAWAITSIVTMIIQWFWAKAKEDPTLAVIKAFALPVRLYLTVLLLVILSQSLGISIIVRQRFSEAAVIVGWVAVLLLLWQLVDVVGSVTRRNLTRRGNLAAFSAVLFLQRGAKIALLVFGVITILSTLGFDVTTGLAALGIGGIALALGAQKTVENFVGGVTLIADQPVRVGDYCKVGDTSGTVEQIGMRSTRIRTTDRTVVTIPNGEFSSLKIENFAHRDRFWFHPVLGLRYETKPDQIRYLLVELRALLYAHPKVDPSSARVRFVGLGRDTLNLEVFSYILVRDNDEFLEIQEDLYLRMLDIIEASGTGLAFPSQTLYMARDSGVSEERTSEAEAKVKQWREAGDLQLPRFNEERIKSLRGTIPYPPEGSIQHSDSK
jgi:MscS family membrane protein